MARARSILKRTRAIRNIRTVTRTMDMVSRARFKKAFSRVAAVRPYTNRMSDLVGDLIGRCGDEHLDHPLLAEAEDVNCEALFVLTSNRGMCGAYNPSVVRMAAERLEQLREAGYQVRLHVAGTRGMRHFRTLGYPMARTYTRFDRMPEYSAIAELADGLMGEFLDRRIGGVEVAYMQFVSAGVSKPAVAQILPLSYLEPPPRIVPGAGVLTPYEFLPSPREILHRLLPATVRIRMYQCFLDAAVSEQLARMTAMQSATENADDMIRDLTIRYNRLRQTQITTELAEIIGGRAGVE